MKNAEGKDLYIIPQFFPILFQPFLPDFVIRQNGRNYIIKSSGVVHFFPMSQLMNNNIVNNFFGSEDQTPVKVEVSPAAAASPAGLLLPDGDPAVSNAHKSCVVSCLLRKNRTGSLDIPSALCI